FDSEFQLFESEEAARTAIMEEVIIAAVIIPDDYPQTGALELLQPSDSSPFSGVEFIGTSDLRPFLVAHLLQDVESSLRTRAVDPVAELSRVTVGDPSDTANPLEDIGGFVVSYAFGILLAVTVFSSSGYLLRGVAVEKESRIVEILISSVSAQELLAGKVIGLGAVGLLQMIVWFGSAFALTTAAGAILSISGGQLLGGLASIGTVALAFVYYLLGFALYAVSMAAAGALGTNQQESQQMAGVFSFIAVIPFMLSGFIFANPESIVMRVLSYFPFTAPTMMLMRLPLMDVPVIDIVVSIASLLVTIPVVLWVGAKIFRLGLLMYGQKPSLSRIWQTLREA
ncbi:MAG: ABC transporter permease, partial [Chloroflexi bacterium]|nr:ABC transporter permease [Chloroflexota bacterium]